MHNLQLQNMHTNDTRNKSPILVEDWGSALLSF